MFFNSRYFSLFLSIFFIISSQAQKGKVQGKIHFQNNQPVQNASLFLKSDNITKHLTSTDENGLFLIENVPYGKYTLEISSLEIIKKQQEINHKSPETKINIAVKQVEAVSLKDVSVKGKTVKQKTEEKGFAVNVIETQEAGLRNLQTNELLDRTVGVRIRQNGGLGSDVNYNLNGISGNGVRIFIDGIPVSTYGSSFNLNSIPPAMIERIEVYKGVIPGHLADDAIGGAINIIMKKGKRNNFNASASYGSFNTTQVNFSGLYRFDNGFTLKSSAFMNHSDNDYEVWGKDIYIILPNGQKKPVNAKIKRFNDAFKSTGSVTEIGFTDVKWADQFFIGFTGSDQYREVQHGTFMTIPYKGRFTSANAKILNLTYHKRNLFTKGLEFNFHGVAGERHQIVNDTVKWRYNWHGEKSIGWDGKPILIGAQQGAPTLANIKRKTASMRTGLSYAINRNHKFLFNYTFNIIKREDDDEIRTVLERNFMGTRDLKKSIASLTYELNAFDNKLKTSLFGKYYQQEMERMNPIVQNINGVPTRVEDIIASNRNITGYGGALSYQIIPNITLLTSAEKAVRLPSEDEIFGNAGDNLSENPNIRPETSQNYNLGFRLGAFELEKHNISFAANGFIRSITERIGQQIQTALNNNIQTLPFVNQGNMKSRGFDVEVNYTFNKNLNIIASASKYNLTTKDNQGNEYQVPNEPFLTSNASVQYSFKNVIQKNAQLNFFYSCAYVDKFSFIRKMYSNTAGTEFFDVPAMFSQDAGLSYIFPNKRFIASFDVKNITDKQLFDNRAVQKPGRAFFLKLNYVINNF